MLKVCVCDDSVEFVRIFINQFDFVCKRVFSDYIKYDFIGAFNSASEVLDYMNKSTVDLLFLDIDMPEMNGFELAKKVTKINPNVMIVFVSGHDHYVFEVFEFSPFGYLRKAKIMDELPVLVKRIKETVERKSVRVDLDTVKGQVSIAVKDVVYIKSEGNYYKIIFNSGDSILCRGTLSSIEKIWTQYDFFRVHAAYIVNLDFIQSVRNNELIVGEYSEVIPISQRRLASFRKEYAAFTLRRFDI